MSDFIQAMTLPFLACLLLAGIHVYLGIHVLARKVIFVDLALAQIAALGAVYGILLGYSPAEHPWIVKIFSLVFATVGALIFSLTRARHERVAHEAIIGITYAVALSMTILASAHLAHGADEVRELLAGSILWVDNKTVLSTAILYLTIGAFHYVFRRQFLLVSFAPHEAEAQGLNLKLWDFLFYFAFGFVVTSSVAIAGVLLVFCYLVIPAVIATLLSDKLSSRLLIGWTVGALVSFIGVVVSYFRDLPSGPTIVVCFAAFLVAIAVLLFVLRSQNVLRQSLKVAVIVVGVFALAWVSLLLRHREDFSPSRMLQSKVKSERLLAVKSVASPLEVIELFEDSDPEIRIEVLRALEKSDDMQILPIFHKALLDPGDNIREMAIRTIRKINNVASIKPLLEAITREEDEYIKVEMAEAVIELGDPRGIPVLIDVMDEGATEIVRQDAYEHLTAHVVLPFVFDPRHPAEKNDQPIKPYRQWWQVNHGKLRWQPGDKKFLVD